MAATWTCSCPGSRGLDLLDRVDPAFGPSRSVIESESGEHDAAAGSEQMRGLVGERTRERVNTARPWVRTLVSVRRDAIERLARTLLDERQTLGADEIVEIIGRAPVAERPDADLAQRCRLEFSPLGSRPNYTHRAIIAYHATESGEPMPIWSCATCGRRFTPTTVRGDA
jgi:hypothetical protein